MKIEAKAQPGKVKFFVVVKDQNGRPKFQNPAKQIPYFWPALSEEDKAILLTDEEYSQYCPEDINGYYASHSG